MKLARFNDVAGYIGAHEFASGSDKTTSLKDAVAGLIRPGCSIHVGITHAFPYAACNEISRRFWGKDPGFTVHTLGAANHIIIWLLGGMLRRLETSYCGDIYPAPGPNPAFNDAYLSGRVEIRNWTVLTYTLRLMAGALGWPFAPTRSLLGSTMEQDNAADLRVIDDPDSGRLALLKPARPDVSIYHAWAADRHGNAIFTPPYSENLWGAMAAREGAIITCEKIVDTEFIRRHSPFVRLPGQYVRAVVHAPMGAHPGGFYTAGIEGLEGYAEDYDFIVEFRRANRKPVLFDGWLEKWVMGVGDHAGYLRELGDDRISALKDRHRADAWEAEFSEYEKGLSDSTAWNPLEFMTVAASREIARRMKAGGCSMILAGQGNSNLAAWMARYALSAEGISCDLVAETGFFGYSPRPGSPFLFNFANIPSCTTLTDALQTLGAFVTGGGDSKCIGSLSAGQVDAAGNINSTCIPGALYLVGSGGANDVASTAREVVLTMQMSPGRFVERVPYVTAPGRAVSAMVTDRGTLARTPDGAFELVSVPAPPSGGPDVPALIAAAREACGWELRAAARVEVEPVPTLAELKLLRAFDPRRAFTGDK
jgi:acyl CoA:acetate/3-ketoacid CoA transferase alpha subunit/acyl CoA:acetate/3-ketoacid CoA transferase beta subunit